MENLIQEQIWPTGLKFCGIKTPHNYYIFNILSTVVERNPQIERIIEFGRSTGSVTINLGLLGVAKETAVHSYDSERFTSIATDKILRRLGVHVHYQDTKNFMVQRNVADAVLNKPVYLVMSSDSMREELTSFIPYLFDESVVTIIGYNRDKELNKLTEKLTPFMEKEWDKYGVK